MVQITLKRSKSDKNVNESELLNHMYIDENMFISNINNITYLCVRIKNVLFKYELLETMWIFDKYKMNFKSNVVLNFERECCRFQYLLTQNGKIIFSGLVKDKYIHNYPYNSTMTKSMIDFEHYSIHQLIDVNNPDSFF